MATSTTSRARLFSGVLAGALLLVPLAGCGNDSDAGDTAATASPTETTAAEPTETTPTETTPTDATDDSGTTDGSNGNADVNCSGTSCSVTLSGNGTQAEILGTTITLDTVQDGRATFRAGDREISCSQGESVSAGPLTLSCETVTEDSVTMTASLG